MSALLSRLALPQLKLCASATRCHSTSSSQTSSPPTTARRSLHSSTRNCQGKNMEKFALAKKYHGLERNVWVEFIALALEYKPLNLGQGLPDDLVPDYISSTLIDVVKEAGPLHQYTRGHGHPRLINALSKLYTRLLNRPTDIHPQNEVVVTDGAYEALFNSIMGLVNPGDEVIIIEPYFDCYEPMVRLAGGIPRFIALAPRKTEGVVTSADWKLDPAELAGMFNSKTKAIIYNNPNNPLGKVYKLDEIEMIADLCKAHNVVCISDDVYEHMVFEGSEMIRMATLPDMFERTITIGSAGKTFSVTGWKLGWAIGPKHLISNCQVVHQNCVYACPTPLQEAVARGFELELSRIDSPDCYFKSISVDLQKKRDYIAQILREVDLVPTIPEGGYFILADWSRLADKIDLSSEEDEQADYRFVKWLSKNRKLQGIPPSAFFSKEHKHIGSNYIRFCFIKHDDSLQKAADILRNWRKELK